MNETSKKDAAELTDLANRIHNWAAGNGIPLAKVIRDYPGLGSDRTWRDLREGRLEGYDVEAQLANYRAALNVLEEVQGANGAEPVYDDLTPVVQLRRAALAAMRCNGTNRVVIVQAPSGGGKTTALRMLCGKYGTRIVPVEAADAWSDRPASLLGAVLRALGVGQLPSGTVERLEKCQELLNVSRRMVAVDEAHHLGPHCLNCIKTLVNTTPGEWLLIAIPTLWAKLETSAYQEARQLSTNRLSERVRMELGEKDIERYLSRAFEGADAAALRHGAKLIRPAAQSSGNLAFVRDVVACLRDIAGEGAVTVQNIADAIQSAAKRR